MRRTGLYQLTHNPIVILTITSALNLVVLAWFAWYSYDYYRETRATIERDSRIEELRGIVVHLDEVLTMSARMAVATGDLRWEERYRTFEPKLDSAIKEAMVLTPEAYRGEAAAQTDAANIRLVEMENRAFDMVRQGSPDSAMAILFGEEYEQQKQIYINGMDDFAVGLAKVSAAHVKQTQRRVFVNSGILILLSPLLVFSWLVVFRAVCRWKTTLSTHNLQLYKQAAALAELTNSLDQRVAERTQELMMANQKLSSEIAERQKIEDKLRQRSHELGERVKELNCLYAVERLVGRSDSSFDDILQDILETIPPSWQYPESTCARIIVDEREFATDNFRPTAWRQSTDLIIDDKTIGVLEVAYLREYPDMVEGPFLGEERHLIDALGVRIARLIQRRRMEEVLRESKETFHAIADSAHDAIIIMNDQGNITFWNNAATKIFDYSKDEAIGHNCHSLVAPGRFHDEFKKNFGEFIKTGKGPAIGNTVELSALRKDGAEFPMEMSLESVKLNGRYSAIAIIRDVSERKRVENEREVMLKSVIASNDKLEQEMQARKKAEELQQQTVDQYTAMINTVPAQMYLKNTANTYTVANEAFCVNADLVGEEIVGKSDADIFPKELAEKYQGEDKSVLDQSRRQINVEEKHAGADGDIRWISTTKVPLCNSSGEIDGVVGLIQDVTEQHLSRAQLMQSEKLAAIGTLAAGVAHEINNPIGFVNSNLNTMAKYLVKIRLYLEQAGQPDTKQPAGIEDLLIDFKDAIEESIEGTGRVKDIVADLKNFSRIDRAEKEYSNINEGLTSTLNVVWNELKYKCKVEKCFGELPELYCMPNELNQVFMNLLVNAGQAITGDAGLIRITTSADTENVYVSIKDNGSGIPEDIQQKIFDPFYTTKDVGKGTGLGLSLSHDIVQKHQGKIEVKSEVGVGTEFIITLPLGGIDEA